jgi:DNA-binding NarL/FixJ family response regulator
MIVDDHQVVRAGLKTLINGQPDLAVVTEASSGREAMEQLRAHTIDVLLLDLSLPDVSGLDVLKHAKAHYESVGVLILSAFPEAQYGLNVLRGGASGFVVKEAAPAELEVAIRAAAAGRTFLSPQVFAPHAPQARSLHGDVDRLSPRQREILDALGAGRTTKQIAGDLGLSVKTVETHRSRMMEVLGCRNSVELLRVAMRVHDAR